MITSSIDIGAFRALTEAAGDAILVSDIRNRILYANPAAHTIFGYTADQLSHLTLPMLMPERFREAHNRGQQRFIATGVPHVMGKTVELAGLRANGEEFPIELSLGAWSSATGEYYFVGIMRDITPRKAADEALSREVALVHLLEALAAAANEAESVEEAAKVCLSKICRELDWPLAHIYQVKQQDEASAMVPMNVWGGIATDAFLEFQRTTSALQLGPGQGLSGTVYSTTKPAWIEDIKSHSNFPRRSAALACGINSAFAVPVLIRTRVVAIIEFFSLHTTSPDLRMIEVASYAASQLGRVIERETAARELRQLNADLEQRVAERTRELQEARDVALDASRAKSAFLANMSHELRTPLNAILGYAEIIHEEASEGGLQSIATDTSRILDSGRHLTRLISDILDLSKIEAGRLELELEQLSVADMIHKAIEVAHPLLQENENRVHVMCSPALVVSADRLRLHQVLLNLLSNAARFTEKGDITVSCDETEDVTRIAVTDSGPGISAPDLKRLFQKFEQLDASPTRRHGGTGLGLVISRTLCRLMGGNLTVSSEPGSGSTFSIELPKRDRASAVGIKASIGDQPS